MRVCVAAVGGSDPLFRAIVQGLGDHNALYYARHPRAGAFGWLYRPDAPSDAVEIVDAPTLTARGVGSCGSLSAAVYGWLRAQGAPALLITTREKNVWHVRVRMPGGSVWDPAKDLRHAA